MTLSVLRYGVKSHTNRYVHTFTYKRPSVQFSTKYFNGSKRTPNIGQFPKKINNFSVKAYITSLETTNFLNYFIKTKRKCVTFNVTTLLLPFRKKWPSLRLCIFPYCILLYAVSTAAPT